MFRKSRRSETEELLRDLVFELILIARKLETMATALENLQAAATAIAAKLSTVEAELAAVPPPAPPGVDPVAVQAVANQLETAAGIPNTTAS